MTYMTVIYPSKICFACNIHLPISEFYKHTRMGDGHLNKCKNCTKKDVRKNRMLKLDYYKSYEKTRQNNDHRVLLRREYKVNPNKKKANSAVSNAIRDNRLFKSTYCEYCGTSDKIEAHHSSYSKEMYMVVTWLCSACHGKIHSKSHYEL